VDHAGFLLRASAWRRLPFTMTTKSSAYAESRVMPILVPDLLVRAVSGFPLSA
jgi:hypothetical protein